MPFESQVAQFISKLGEDPVLQPHQKRVVNKLTTGNHGIVAYHSPGSGKTLTSIEAIKSLNKPTLVTPPAALKENYRKELKKWDSGGKVKDLRMQSQQTAATGGLLPHSNDSFLVMDEAHKARDPQSKLHQEIAKSKAKKLLMTGSGVYNHPADLSSLINLAANKQVLPTDRNEFEQKFVDYDKVEPSFIQRLAGLSAGEKPKLNATPELKDAYKKYVDFYESKTDSKDFPTLKEEEKIVTMTPKQTELYNAIMGKAPLWTRMKVKAGLPPNRKELAKLKAFLTGPRQASNSTGAFYPNVPAESAKATEAFSSLQKQMAANPNHKAVVYSNYLSSGLQDYKNLLESNSIPYGEFSGDIPDNVRQDMVRKFNENKLKALLISSAGAEGLDLKGTRQVQLLEPHFNEEKERQIIGRAKRFKSHEHLPENERNVLVERYMARPKGSFIDKIIGGGHARGVDEYLRDIAKNKSALNDQVINLLRDQQKSRIFGL